jgi:hypothetical protein
MPRTTGKRLPGALPCLYGTTNADAVLACDDSGDALPDAAGLCLCV